MRKFIISFIFLGCFVFSLSADELYVVKRGDTLWDICEKYYQDPFLWPKLWQINPQITNPHWIYPGDVLCLKETPEALIEATKKIEGQKKKEISFDWRYLEAVGYLLPYKEKSMGEIIKAVGEDKVILGQGDKVFIRFKENVKPKLGTIWTIFRISPVIKHPVTGKNIGYIHEILGTVKLTHIYQHMVEAQIVRSYDVIYVGDHLKPYEAFKPFSISNEKPKNIKAYIVASRAKITEIGWPEVVYIDAGEEQGLKPGQILDIFREKKNFPPLPLGQVLIIHVTPKTATAIILKSKYPFHSGDLVTALK